MPEAHTVQLSPDLGITVQEVGDGRPVLVLHGGGGPATVAAIAERFAGASRVLLPTHPGWNSTPRPEWLHTIEGLAGAYIRLLAKEDLHDVAVVGSSVGGWLGAELTLADEQHRITELVLVDSVGVAIEGEPIRDFFALDARGVAEYSYHDAARFYVDPATMAPELAERMRGNLAALRVYAGDPYMHDPTLLSRVGGIGIPALVVWGDSDRIATPSYGRTLARAIPDAQFALIENAGHLPHLEQPAATFRALDRFLRRPAH